MALRNAFENLSTEAKQDAANAILAAIRDQVKDATTDTVLTLLRDIADNKTVALDAATLSALENITVTVSSEAAGLATEMTLGSILAKMESGLAKEATLASILTELGQKLEPADLSALSTAARQDLAQATLNDILTRLNGGVAVTNFPAVQPVSGTVTVANPTANPETGLAKETTLQGVLSAVDGLELSIGDVDINTDQLEGLTQTLIDLIASAEAARDTDATAAQTRLNLLATEAKLEQLRNELANVLTDGSQRTQVTNFPVNQTVSGTVTVANPTANPETGLAKDTTLTSGAQRTEVTNLPANQAVSVTAPLPAGTNNIGFVSPSSSQKVAQGRFNLAGTGRLSLSVAGNVRVRFLNPLGSGKTLSIVRIAGISTSTGWATIIVNPSTGLPTGTVRPVTNAVVGGGVPAVGQVTVDTHATDPLAGGTDTGIVIGLGANTRTTIDLPPLVIAAGVSVGINIPFAGSAEASLSVYWIED